MPVLVNGTWPLDFDEEKYKHKKTSFLYWIKERPSHISAHSAAQYRMYDQIRQDYGDIDVAVEYFAGVGVDARHIENLLHPKEHYMFDLDPDCVEHLKAQQWKGNVHIELGDAKELMGTIKADVVACDFAQFSAIQLKQQWEEHLDRVFANKPFAFRQADTALSMLYPSIKRYSEILDYPIKNHRDYMMALAEYYRKRWGYKARVLLYRPQFAGYMLLYRGDRHETFIEPVPDIEGLSFV